MLTCTREPVSGVVSRLAQPPGVRSTRRRDGTAGEGGTWVPARDSAGDGGSHYAHEIARVLRGAPSIEIAVTKAELATKLRRATQGLLTFGADGDVDQMSVAPRVLEIRIKSVKAVGFSLHIRLYFTEPAHEPGCLLMLLLEGKSPGRIGLEEQNDHARAADLRIDRHYGIV